jgi:hypothetical protein
MFIPRETHIHLKTAMRLLGLRWRFHLSEDGRCRRLVEVVANYVIYTLDPEGIVLSWNAGAQCFKDTRLEKSSAALSRFVHG